MTAIGWIERSRRERLARFIERARVHHGSDDGPGVPIVAVLDTRRHYRPLRLVTTLRLRDGTPTRRLLRP